MGSGARYLASDYDAVNGLLRVTKARVAGIDKNCTKTGEDRIVTLCPRAIRILARQLKLRERLQAVGLLDRDHLFFSAEGAVIRHRGFNLVKCPFDALSLLLRTKLGSTKTQGWSRDRLGGTIVW